ncbi:MAG: hypothetical protein BWY99_01453 [Synergistetes bacterium ADurb.BinA166]|nr:MAG: hypothetical protein BWY99_01453 [Synergistetes bacterium ADurb.BinA166]
MKTLFHPGASLVVRELQGRRDRGGEVAYPATDALGPVLRDGADNLERAGHLEGSLYARHHLVDEGPGYRVVHRAPAEEGVREGHEPTVLRQGREGPGGSYGHVPPCQKHGYRIARRHLRVHLHWNLVRERPPRYITPVSERPSDIRRLARANAVDEERRRQFVRGDRLYQVILALGLDLLFSPIFVLRRGRCRRQSGDGDGLLGPIPDGRHVGQGCDEAEGVIAEVPPVAYRAHEPAVYVDRAAAHPRSDAPGPLDNRPGGLYHHQVARSTLARDHAYDLDRELHNLFARDHRQGVALHAGAKGLDTNNPAQGRKRRGLQPPRRGK